MAMRALLALTLLAPLALAQDEPALAGVAARTAKAGKPWVHKQPMAAELAYDYARAGRRLVLKPAADGYERERIVTFDADKSPFDLIFVAKRVKKDKGVLYLVDSMTLRVDLDGNLVAAVRASGRDAEVVRSSVPVSDFYVRQVFEREMAYLLKGVVRDPNSHPAATVE